MTQGSLLAVAEKQELTPQAVLEALRGRGWILRERLALELGCSVRRLRMAVAEASGGILSSEHGLKLTAEASEDEVNEALGRFNSQIHQMSVRVVQTREVWENRFLQSDLKP